MKIDTITEKMLKQCSPLLKRTWTLFGSPNVRPSLVDGQYEAALSLTPALSRTVSEANILTPRDSSKPRSDWFRKNQIKEIAKLGMRGQLLPYVKEIAVCAKTGKILTGNHFVQSPALGNYSISVRVRFGAVPEEGPIDGKQTAWTPAQRLGLPPDVTKIINNHFRIREKNRSKYIADVVMLEWYRAHKEPIDLVLQHMPKTNLNGVREGYDHAPMQLALVEAVEKTKDNPKPMLKFLVALRDLSDDLPLVSMFRNWMERNAQFFSNEREKVYGAAVSFLKHYLSNNPHRPKINTRTRWEIEEPHVEPVPYAEQAGIKAIKQALGLSTSLAKSVASYSNFNGSNPIDTLRTLKKVDKNILAAGITRGLQVAKAMNPFSPRAMTVFILRNLDDPMLNEYLSGLSLNILVEDWKVAAWSKRRFKLEKSKVIDFDLPWIGQHFEQYRIRRANWNK